MRITMLAIAAVGTIVQLAGAQQPRRRADDDRDPRARRVDSVFAAFDRTDSPGCAVGVYQDDTTLYARGYGMANLELGIANSNRTVFEIGSISKEFTALAILLLQQDGKLSVDDPVRKYVPELPAYADHITLRNLLSHTSGIRDHFGLQEVEGVSFDGVQDTVDYLRLITKQQQPNFEPGTKYLYSNSGYVLLAQIVYRVSGMPLARFAAQRIFGPLGMRDTRFQESHAEIIVNRATAYMPQGDHFAIRMSMFDQMAGAAGIHTTVEDFGRWLANYDAGRVGGHAAVDAMTTPMKLKNDSLAMTTPETAYGFGLDIGTYRGLPMISHTGSWGGYRSAFMRFPKQRFGVATFCNYTASGPDSLAKKVAAIYLGSEMAANADSAFRAALAGGPRETPAAGALANLVGVWRNADLGQARITKLAGDTLLFPPNGENGRPTVLVSLGGGRFRAGPASEAQFQGDSAGAPNRLVIRSATGFPATFVRVAPAALTDQQLAEYAGSYYTPEVDVTWSAVVEKGKLVVMRSGRRVGTLVPTWRDGFVMGATELDFQRDRKGRLTGFTVEAGRVRHLKFERTKD